MTTVRELRIALTVDDYERAVAFYRDALGLPEVESWDRPNGRGTILDAIEVGRRTSGVVRLALRVDDSGAVAGQLVEAGATREHELVETPWGDRNVRVRAPDGMQLTLFTPAETPIAWSGEPGEQGLAGEGGEGGEGGEPR